jgi:NADH:quinone reductase (non-electrogenic)
MADKQRVLILGGGFAGLYAAMHLEKALRRQDDFDVVLVNRENFFLFTPMLHEVAASDLDLTNIVSPVRQLLKRVKFFQGDVEAVDLPSRHVTVSHGFNHHTHDLNYDQLIIALGSITNFFNLPGLAERALTVKSLGDAIHLRNRLIQLLEEADTECAAGNREPLLTFVVAGGGFAGVETIAGIHDFVCQVLPFYPHIDKKLVRAVLVHPGKFILPELGEELGGYAQTKLSERGVEIRDSSKVTSVTDEGVHLSDGEFVRTNTVIWTAGTSPNALLETLPCQKERGRVCVNEFLEVPGFPGVWALGDAALIPDSTTGKFCPPTAQHALREGKIAAHNVLVAMCGGRKKPFVFSGLGQLAAIGRRTGVAKIFGFKFSGFVAWWMWRTIYLSKLPRFEKKLRVALDWTLDLFFAKDMVQFTTVRAPTVSNTEGAAMEPSKPAADRRSTAFCNTNKV